jgi:hypothetical protein
MGWPVGPWTQVLMIADQVLHVQCQASRLPDVQVGQAFWASTRDQASLIAAGQAHDAPANTPAPEPEPAWTANQVPGFGYGTANCSH